MIQISYLINPMTNFQHTLLLHVLAAKDNNTDQDTFSLQAIYKILLNVFSVTAYLQLCWHRAV